MTRCFKFPLFIEATPHPDIPGSKSAPCPILSAPKIYHCKYKLSTIRNSVKNDSSKKKVLSKPKSDNLSDGYLNAEEVKPALAAGTSCALNGLNSEHFVNAGSSFTGHISLSLSVMIKRSHSPALLTQVVLVPLWKDNTGNVSDRDNYRSIAKASVVSKTLEVVILNRRKRCLGATDHQLGFKQNHATDTVIHTIKYITTIYAISVRFSCAFWMPEKLLTELIIGTSLRNCCSVGWIQFV